MNLLPLFTKEGILDGNYIHTLSFCKRHCNSSKCQSYYSSIMNKNGFHCCPHGLTSFVDVKKRIIYTGFRCKPHYITQKAKKISRSEEAYNEVLPLEQIEDLIKISIQIDGKNKDLFTKEALLDSVSHEIKKLNSQIKEQCDAILESHKFLEGESSPCVEEETTDVQAAFKTIYVSASLIDSRFSFINYEKNTDLLKTGSRFNFGIYGKFHKLQRIFKNYQRRGIPISISGESFGKIKAYQSFELIPMLIIENAVKYSYGPDFPVKIEFDDNGNGDLWVSITSFGPYCTPEEIAQIFEKGFRGKFAKKTVSDGNGIGLYFVKQLCDIHNIEIKVTSDNKTTLIDGIDYSYFTVELAFHDLIYVKPIY